MLDVIGLTFHKFMIFFHGFEVIQRADLFVLQFF